MIDLAPFCRPGDDKVRKWAISQPWNQGEYCYATDGRILVRVAKRDWLPDPKGIVPKAEETEIDAEGNWKLLPPVCDLPADRKCEYCTEGKCQPTVCCRWCDAETPYPGQEFTCRECGGSTFYSRVLDDAVVATKYLLKLADLPEPVEYFVGHFTYGKEIKKAVYFRFSGGRGVLLTIRPKEADDA